MTEIKLECGCGQHFAFEVEPFEGRMPCTVQCPACGADGTAAADQVLAVAAASSDQGPVLAEPEPARPARTQDPAQKIRTEHLPREQAIQAIGLFYMVFAGLLLIVIAIIPFSAEHGSGADLWGTLIAGIILSAIHGWVGTGLRELAPWSRYGASALAALGLLVDTSRFFVPGLLMHCFILYSVLSRQGATVLSRNYAKVMAATPHLRPDAKKVKMLVTAILLVSLAYLILTT